MLIITPLYVEFQLKYKAYKNMRSIGHIANLETSSNQ